MNCREFQAQHCAFVDDTLSLAAMAEMGAHLDECAACASHDTRVRRSLLVVRNAPRLECSSDFAQRLQARLHEIGPIDRSGTRVGYFPMPRLTTLSAGLAAAAAIAVLATAIRYDDATPEVRMAPVVASLPEPDPMPLAMNTPAYVASVMSGMPVWSAVMGAGESSMHMANYEFQLAGYTR